MSIFQLGEFQLHSGTSSYFKIECGYLFPSDWKALATVIARIMPPFGSVEGVPMGGLELEDALKSHIDSSSETLLIVDDVYTTGGSMESHRNGREAIGCVVFARNPVTHRWITPLFQMASKNWYFAFDDGHKP